MEAGWHRDAERAEHSGLVLSLGAEEAAKRTGVPIRSLYNWRKAVSEGTGISSRIIPAATREEVADTLWQSIQVGSAEVLRSA